MFVVAAFAAPAFAQPFQEPVEGLARVGPVTQTHGYPNWYQDKTGITLEFCDIKSQGELDGGYCLLLRGDTTFPENFPSVFADEHFYWAADAVEGNARLTLGLEAAFGQGPVKAGDQVVFGRLRIRYDDLPEDGTYTVYTPYGKFVFPGMVAGERLVQTFDIGFGCPQGQFDCALTSHVGPFLLRSVRPGGPEEPPHTFEGRRYVAAPGIAAPVTGSPLPEYETANGERFNPNIFRIEGPDGSVLIQTFNFTLMGRIHEGAIPGDVKNSRATYAVSGADIKIDAFATAFAPITPRAPGDSVQAPAAPVLAFFPVPCVDPAPEGGQLFAPQAARLVLQNDDSLPYFWNQITGLTRDTLPTHVCLEDSTARNAQGQSVPTFSNLPVTDEVRIAQALYGAGTLNVVASSSDPLAQLTVGEFNGPVVGGLFTRANLAAPPSRITVNSLAGGRADLLVSTSGAFTPPPPVPVAVSDSFTTAVNEPVTMDVLANDRMSDGSGLPGGATVAITTQPAKGSASVNADNTILFTPAQDAVGGDSLQYTVSANGLVSSVGQVTITITSPTAGPLAANDTATTNQNQAVTIDVLANDRTGAGGPIPAGAAVEVVTQPTKGTATVGADNRITFTPTLNANGADSLQYTVTVDGQTSNSATVAITIIAAAAPSAANDSAQTLEDQAIPSINVLGNDLTSGGGPIAAADATITITQPGGLGVATLNADKTLSYTPNTNANGNDTVRYRVSVNGILSNEALVSIAIAAQNDAPAAVNDAFDATAGTTFALSVLTNDTDADNAVSGITAVSAVSGPGAATAVAAGTVISFTALADGTYTFTYRAVDAAGLQSANAATVTVTVSALSETIAITQAQYRPRQARWIVSGTSSVRNGQFLDVYHRLNGIDTLIGRAQVAGNGTWSLDARGTGIVPVAGSSQVKVENPATRAVAFLAVTFR